VPPPKSMKLTILLLIAVLVCRPSLLVRAERHSENSQVSWKESLTAAAKGTRIALPGSILKDVQADPDECLDPSPDETSKVDAYQRRTRNLVLVAVWGRSSCFCGATGNCTFWLYSSRSGKNKLLLQTEMVNQFGFLHTTSKGLPDLVLWSHDSAERFPGAFWKFNGAEYSPECGWEVVSTFRDAPSAKAEWVESHVENNTCKFKVVPEAETNPKTSSKSK